MLDPLVSICIPAYRARAFLGETLCSVAAQTYQNWELVVVEDGDDDGSERLVREFLPSVKQKVSYVKHEENRGLPAARNSGIRQARGVWVAFLDADDLWLPTHLSDLVATALHHECEVVSTVAVAFDSLSGTDLFEYAQTEEILREFPVSLYDGHLTILPSSSMVRRQAFEEHGLVSEEYSRCNDTEFWFRLASRGARFAFTRKATCRYRKHSNSMSSAHAENLIELAQLYNAYAFWSAIPRKLRRRKAASVYRYAGRCLRKTDRKKARSLFLTSLRLRRLEASTWFFLLRTFIPEPARKARGFEAKTASVS